MRAAFLAFSFFPSVPRRFCPLPVLAGLTWLLLVCLPALGEQRPQPWLETETPKIAGDNCVVMARLGTRALEQHASSVEQQKGRPPISEKELRRPMTEREIRLLMHTLEPVYVEEDRTWAIRGLVEGTELSVERMRVLLGDAVSVLASLQARETLDRIRRKTDMEDGVRTWAERTLETIPECVRARFAARGGERAVAESIRVVDKHRPELERMLLDSLRLQSSTVLGLEGEP